MGERDFIIHADEYVAAKLKVAAAENGINETDLLRDAIATYLWIMKQYEAGGDFVLVRDGRAEEVHWRFQRGGVND